MDKVTVNGVEYKVGDWVMVTRQPPVDSCMSVRTDLVEGRAYQIQGLPNAGAFAYLGGVSGSVSVKRFVRKVNEVAPPPAPEPLIYGHKFTSMHVDEVAPPPAPAQGPGQKDDSDKLRTDLLPMRALSYVLNMGVGESDTIEDLIQALADYRAEGDLDDLARATRMCLHFLTGGEGVGVALEEVCQVLHYGAYLAPRPDGSKGYGENNWQGVRPAGRYSAAQLRHVFRFSAGEIVDKDSRRPHLAHAGCCGLFELEIKLVEAEKDAAAFRPVTKPVHWPLSIPFSLKYY